MTAAPSLDLRSTPVVLLDLDGTVVESAPGILAALDHAFAACGEEHPGAERLQSFIGPPLADSFRSELGLDDERSEALRLAYSEHYLESGYRRSAPYAGMAELIAALRAEGRTVAIATNKPETTAVRVLEHQGLTGELDLIGGTDLAAGRTHKAQVIASVMERLGASPADGSVMVGDLRERMLLEAEEPLQNYMQEFHNRKENMEQYLSYLAVTNDAFQNLSGQSSREALYLASDALQN